MRLATAVSNEGAQILRRAFSYNDGTNFTAERWPPWRQGLEYDAGLFFIAYQRDPRRQFIAIQSRLAVHDRFTVEYPVPIGSGIYAVPPGIRPGGYAGESILA